jgi:hypothetical protein
VSIRVKSTISFSSLETYTVQGWQGFVPPSPYAPIRSYIVSTEHEDTDNFDTGFVQFSVFFPRLRLPCALLRSSMMRTEREDTANDDTDTVWAYALRRRSITRRNQANLRQHRTA